MYKYININVKIYDITYIIDKPYMHIHIKFGLLSACSYKRDEGDIWKHAFCLGKHGLLSI